MCYFFFYFTEQGLQNKWYFWISIIRYIMICYDALRYVSIRYDTLRYVTIRYDTLRYVITIHYDSYDTLQYMMQSNLLWYDMIVVMYWDPPIFWKHHKAKTFSFKYPSNFFMPHQIFGPSTGPVIYLTIQKYFYVNFCPKTFCYELSANSGMINNSLLQEVHPSCA